MLDRIKKFENMTKEQMRNLIEHKHVFEEAEFYYLMLKLHDNVKIVLNEADNLPKEVRERMEFNSQYKRLQELLFEIAKALSDLF